MKPSWLTVRVGEHLLDVVLDEGDRRREERGERADEGDDRHRRRRETNRKRQAADQVDAGRDHRGGVDERGDRRRAGHRVGQPDVERDLRALAGAPRKSRRRWRDGQR